MSTTRNNVKGLAVVIATTAATTAAGTAGESATIRPGSRVVVQWSGGRGGRGGFRGADGIHDTESTADRAGSDDPQRGGTFVKSTTTDYTDRNGRRYGRAIRLDGGMVHDGNVHAVTDNDGNVVHRHNDDGTVATDPAGRPVAVGRWLPIDTARGTTRQLVAVLD